LADAPVALADALRDRYVLERELGGGGMSRVFLATETALDRRVVIKVLAPGIASGLSAERFRREIQLAARLQHPHIVPLFSAGQADGLLYYTMPWISGESLRAKLRREGELPIPDTIRILRDVLDGLAYAHAQGVVHRDIKPENVLLTGLHAVVADFGVAKALRAAVEDAAFTTAGFTLGTPAYMAPEQAAADPNTDHRADVYAVGVMAYEMLAGQPPFSAPTPQALLAAHFTQSPEALARRRPNVPPTLEALVMRCLEKRPADRWQRAEDMLHALEGILTPAGGTLATAAAPGTDQPPTPPPFPNRGRFVLATAGVLLLAGVGGALWLTGVLGRRSLVAQGVLAAKDPILVADFAARASDSSLGATIAGALRVDLSQSRVVGLAQPERVRQALERMGRSGSAPLDANAAREVAEREGIKAVLGGEVARLGTGYTVSARLLATTTGDELAAFRETAPDSTGLIAAVGRLSQEIRARIGEPLKAIRSTPPLERVTTASLPALQRYTRAWELYNRAVARADSARALALLEEAVALDSGFAMAYRKIAVELANQGEQRERVESAMRRAMANLDRLTEAERYLTTGTYYGAVDYQPLKAIEAYRALLELEPTNWLGLNNLAVLYAGQRRWGAAVELARRLVPVHPSRSDAEMGLAGWLVDDGQVAEARRVFNGLRSGEGDHGVSPWLAQGLAIGFAAAGGRYGAADSVARRFLAESRGNEDREVQAKSLLVALATVRGRLVEAERLAGELMEAEARRGNSNQALFWVAYLARTDARLRGEPARAWRRLEAGARRFRLADLSPLDSRYLFVASAYALAGQAQRARDMLAATRGRRKPDLHYDLAADHYVLAAIAERERRFDDAIAELHDADSGQCGLCPKPHFARAFALAGMTDSAIAYYRTYLDRTDSFDRVWLVAPPFAWLEPSHRGEAYEALGRLYEGRGDRARALETYGRLVDLWRDADPDLQPRVREARRRIASLAGEPGES
jgi:tetratricopeptide (TPR) repeat protein/tRNA A-37 threonylcarbamoyl transferase component Bud32